LLCPSKSAPVRTFSFLFLLAHSQSQGKTVTFNPGSAADPAYYDFSDDSDDPDFDPDSKPTMMSYENFYRM